MLRPRPCFAALSYDEQDDNVQNSYDTIVNVIEQTRCTKATGRQSEFHQEVKDKLKSSKLSRTRQEVTRGTIGMTTALKKSSRTRGKVTDS